MKGKQAEPEVAIPEITDLESARAVAKIVVDALYETYAEDYYVKAGKGPVPQHPLHAMVALRRFAEGK